MCPIQIARQVLIVIIGASVLCSCTMTTAPTPKEGSAPVPTSPAAAEPSSGASSSVPVQPTATHQYIGCFKDQGSYNSTEGHDLSGAFSNDPRMNTQMCVDQCRAKGFAYAGTQRSTYCFCGNNYGRSGPADNCDARCAGNATEICGGVWANSVYSIGAVAAALTPRR